MAGDRTESKKRARFFQRRWRKEVVSEVLRSTGSTILFARHVAFDAEIMGTPLLCAMEHSVHDSPDEAEFSRA